MTEKYDRSKVSPGPWRDDYGAANTLNDPVLTRDGNGKIICLSANDKALQSVTGLFSSDNRAHAIHCVNNHDDLVKALENCLGWMKSFNQDIDEVPCEVSRDMYQSEQILNRAKGKDNIPDYMDVYGILKDKGGEQ